MLGTRRDKSPRLVLATCPTNSSHKPLVARLQRPFSSRRFEFVGQELNLLEFLTKMASSHEGTCLRDFSQGLVPSCTPAIAVEVV